MAAIWLTGWRESHLGQVPDELVAVRTPERFRERAAARVDDTVVVEVAGRVAGFVMVTDDEVERVYVAADHRGAGVADRLLAAAEERIAAAGHAEAWLAVVPGNHRARRFYLREGWTDTGLFDHRAPDAAGGTDNPIPVACHRYTKRVGPQK